MTLSIRARIENGFQRHRVVVSTRGEERALCVGPRAEGYGSSVNGGEMLCVALATCYCNDLYREAAKMGIAVRDVVVEVDAEFGAPGEAAVAIRYRASIAAAAPQDAIRALMAHTDQVAEVQATLRKGMPVAFEPGIARSEP